jgi:hypothetical protein
MELAVAGLDSDGIKKRTEQLANPAWSAFTPAEQLALQFGYRLTKEPWRVTSTDVARLVDTFGKDRALDLIWHVAWCNYMTRVADAFQLPLERENVFAPMPSTEKK